MKNLSFLVATTQNPACLFTLCQLCHSFRNFETAGESCDQFLVFTPTAARICLVLETNTDGV